MLSAARNASKALLENSRKFSSLTLKSGYNPVLANARAQKYDVGYKSFKKATTPQSEINSKGLYFIF